MKRHAAHQATTTVSGRARIHLWFTTLPPSPGPVPLHQPSVRRLLGCGAQRQRCCTHPHVACPARIGNCRRLRPRRHSQTTARTAHHVTHHHAHSATTMDGAPSGAPAMRPSPRVVAGKPPALPGQRPLGAGADGKGTTMGKVPKPPAGSRPPRAAPGAAGATLRSKRGGSKERDTAAGGGDGEVSGACAVACSDNGVPLRCFDSSGRTTVNVAGAHMALVRRAVVDSCKTQPVRGVAGAYTECSHCPCAHTLVNTAFPRLANSSTTRAPHATHARSRHRSSQR